MIALTSKLAGLAMSPIETSGPEVDAGALLEGEVEVEGEAEGEGEVGLEVEVEVDEADSAGAGAVVAGFEAHAPINANNTIALITSP